MTMKNKKVALHDVCVKFRLSYDVTRNFKDTFKEIGKYVLHGKKPRYFAALDQVSLSFYDGDVVGVIGPNGSGKSTLLRTIGRIYHPDEGSVNTYGKISTLLSLGTGFDNKLNGFDNIMMNGLILGLNKTEIESRMEQIIEFADIGEHINIPMKYYSSGMISRVSFSIVLAMQPDIILIDEVFSVGDLQFQRKSAKALHELLNKAACQIIVTHNLGFVEQHCNRAVYISGGRVIADGEPAEVVRCYQGRSATPSVNPSSH